MHVIFLDIIIIIIIIIICIYLPKHLAREGCNSKSIF